MTRNNTTTDITESLLKIADRMGELAEKVGQLTGGQTASNAELGRLNAELLRMAQDLNAKHAENIRLIEDRHKQHQEFLEEHKNDDTKHFERLFKRHRYYDRILILGTGIVGAIITLAAFIKWVLPVAIDLKKLAE